MLSLALKHLTEMMFHEDDYGWKGEEMEIKRLPKGHKVLLQVSNTEDWRAYYDRAKISPAVVQDGKRLQIECFVSGDTEELGLSIVALDDPNCCVARAGFHDESTCPECQEVRKQATEGLIDRACYPNYIGGSPRCPY